NPAVAATTATAPARTASAAAPAPAASPAPAATPQDHRADRNDQQHRELDAIIGAKAVGVTPDYIEGLRRAAPQLGIGLDEATGARALGVTPEYVQAMMATGLRIRSFDDIMGARAVGVNPAYIRSIVSAGYRGDLDDYIALAGMKVTADDVRRLKRAGMPVGVDSLALIKHGASPAPDPDADSDPDSND
ncbi:hypothetical protein ACCC88_22340, partial [Sphingomonas sp. Sphisp140]